MPEESRHVTAICPTTGRRRVFLPYAIRWFLAQDWKDSDLLIVGDGDDLVGDLVPVDKRVRYLHLGAASRPLGQKYNECVERARGPWIALWADDDWNAPWRLRAAMETLLVSGREIVGAREMLFHRIGGDTTWRYERPGDPAEPYFLGGSVVFHKQRYFLRHRFDDIAKRNADAAFTNAISKEEYAECACVLSVTALGSYVATIHPDNTGRDDADPSGPGWSVWAGELGAIMGPDADLYLPDGDIAVAIR